MFTYIMGARMSGYYLLELGNIVVLLELQDMERVEIHELVALVLTFADIYTTPHQ